MRMAIFILGLCILTLVFYEYLQYMEVGKLEQRIQVIEQRLDATDSGNGNVFNQDR